MTKSEKKLWLLNFFRLFADFSVYFSYTTGLAFFQNTSFFTSFTGNEVFLNKLFTSPNVYFETYMPFYKQYNIEKVDDDVVRIIDIRFGLCETYTDFVEKYNYMKIKSNKVFKILKASFRDKNPRVNNTFKCKIPVKSLLLYAFEQVNHFYMAHSWC